MIKSTMRFVTNITRRKVFVGLLYAMTLLFTGILITSSNTFAAGGVGSGGTPGTGGGNGYYSDNGFGWKLYNVTSRTNPPGQLGAMTDGSWASVYDACHDIGQVWMFMIFNKSGIGKEYALHYYVNSANDNSIGFFEVKPGTGRIYYNGHVSNGSYYAQHYVGSASENTVHGYFNKAVSDGIIDPGSLTYGNSVGWFCYSDSRYELTPVVSVSPSAGEGGSAANVTATVNNAGPTVSKSVDWALYTFNIAPGAAIPSGGVSPLTGQSFYGNNAALVANGTRTFDKGSVNLSIDAQRLPDVAIGTRVCFGLSLRPYSSSDSTNGRHSTPACVTIAKKPKIQIHGGDLIVGRSFVGGGSTSNAGVNTSQTVKYR